ncbi:hypothetical protein AAFF_G00400750 [Aldrovandia affinis]|uniref:Uncharacterized protein n=1 Tax=Aldrovandia affinis TaxID=143900 RepID=A0AAD7SCC7_9TELE|nr:hypothetical protein AAFF_G00400750 [Aldrovandia affinis]
MSAKIQTPGGQPEWLRGAAPDPSHTLSQGPETGDSCGVYAASSSAPGVTASGRRGTRGKRPCCLTLVDPPEACSVAGRLIRTFRQDRALLSLGEQGGAGCLSPITQGLTPPHHMRHPGSRHPSVCLSGALDPPPHHSRSPRGVTLALAHELSSQDLAPAPSSYVIGGQTAHVCPRTSTHKDTAQPPPC